MARRTKLSDDAKAYVVQALACFDSPSTVAAAVRKEFGASVTRQSIQEYDPTKATGRNCAERWRQLFEATRDAFLKDASGIAISHRSVRLRALQRMVHAAEEVKNYHLAAQLLEQAARECGDAYTNRRQLSGPNGGAIRTISAKITPDMSVQEAADLYAATLNGGP